MAFRQELVVEARDGRAEVCWPGRPAPLVLEPGQRVTFAVTAALELADASAAALDGAGGRQDEDGEMVWKVARIVADDEQNNKVREDHLKKARRILRLLASAPCGGAAGGRPLSFNEVAQRSIDEFDRGGGR